jgi:hypothetical protein
MKTLALGLAALLAGCAAASDSAPGHDPTIAKSQRESQKISQRERDCERGPQTAISLAQCKAMADQENSQLAARQRDEYQETLNQARENRSLMMTLQSSLQH